MKKRDYYDTYLKRVFARTQDMFGISKNNLTFIKIKVRSPDSKTHDHNLRGYFKCVCGEITLTEIRRVLIGKTKSCGCIKRNIAFGNKYRLSHGASIKGNPLFRTHCIWLKMRDRSNPNNSATVIRGYADRGILCAKEWEDFKVFLSDMGAAPEDMSLGRIDNSKGYSKENCRWETVIQQANNKRTNKIVVYRNESDTIANLCRKHNAHYVRVLGRIYRGWDINRAFEEPVNLKKPKSQ